MSKGNDAKALFLSGSNCAQSVAVAFADETGMSADTVGRLTIGFGGGIGRMREACGCICGMTFVISAIYAEDKANVYKRVQEVSDIFRRENGSIVCRELLGLSINGADSPVPEPRTKEYYKKRPCAELVELAANILEEYLKSNPA